MHNRQLVMLRCQSQLDPLEQLLVKGGSTSESEGGAFCGGAMMIQLHTAYTANSVALHLKVF